MIQIGNDDATRPARVKFNETNARVFAAVADVVVIFALRSESIVFGVVSVVVVVVVVAVVVGAALASRALGDNFRSTTRNNTNGACILIATILGPPALGAWRVGCRSGRATAGRTLGGNGHRRPHEITPAFPSPQLICSRAAESQEVADGRAVAALATLSFYYKCPLGRLPGRVEPEIM
jgi:hypothetical protein